jgi:hypothetical protein
MVSEGRSRRRAAGDDCRGKVKSSGLGKVESSS